MATLFLATLAASSLLAQSFPVPASSQGGILVSVQ
jgi:hypothetical protein